MTVEAKIPTKTRAEEPLTDEEYVAKKGAVCPFCGSDNLVGEEVEINSDMATQAVGCLDCDKEWEDHYTLTGYAIYPEEGDE